MAAKKQVIMKRTKGAKKPDGFYARQFSPQEILDLKALIATGLDDEIAMLRVVLRRYYEEVNNTETLEGMGAALDRISLVTTRLAGLVKTQNTLKEKRHGEMNELITRALEQVQKEMELSI